MKIKFTLILIALIPSLLYAQTDQEKKHISKTIWELSLKPTESFSQDYKNGKAMLALSKNNFERAKSYGHMGDALMKQMKYSEALQHLQKADQYAENAKYISEQIMINHIMQNIYVKIGMYDEAEIKLNKAKNLAHQIQLHDYDLLLVLSHAVLLESKGDYCAAIPYREKYDKIIQSSPAENLISSNITEENLNLYGNYSILAYSYIKCQQIEKAILNLDKAEHYHEKVNFVDHQQNALFYLCKALIAEKQKNSKNALYWMSKAEKSAKQWQNSFTLNKIAEEKLLNKIVEDDSVDQDFQTYKATSELKQKEILELTNLELSNKRHLLNKEYSLVNTLLLILGFLLIAFAMLLFLLKKRKYHMQKRFEEIIKKLENHHEEQETQPLPAMHPKQENKDLVFNTKLDLQKIDEHKRISDEKEKEILDNLKRFENGQKFTTPGFMLSNLTAILKTNNSYTTHILKQHRGKSFSDYIISLRIKFVIEKLYDNPEFLNYKISYISDLAGFSSHSKFTQAFKKEAQMPPSDFIRMVREKNEPSHITI